MYGVGVFRVKINKNIYLFETTCERAYENASEEDVYGLDNNDGIKKKKKMLIFFTCMNFLMRSIVLRVKQQKN